MLDEDFIKSLDPDPFVALAQLSDQFEALSRESFIEGTGWDVDQWKRFLDYLAVSRVLLEKTSLSVLNTPEVVDVDPSSFMHQTARYFTELKNELIQYSMKSRYESSMNAARTAFGDIPVIELTDNAIGKIQRLITEMRDLLSGSKDIPEAHKRRLLNRLERMQSELHKRMSDADVFWGGFVDAGVAMGKFGEAAKPFFDRMKDIRDIIWKAQRTAEQIESLEEPPAIPDQTT